MIRIDRINQGFNETLSSGAGATGYDAIHGYAEDEQHDYPARGLIGSVWAPEGFGRALELGAGSGYFTPLIARRATSVVAVEPVTDLARVLRKRSQAEGLVRPGGHLCLLEPHHNVLRAARLFRKYVSTYRARAFWTDERNWATHDFLTRGELVSLCRGGGFDDVRVSGFWIPYSRRIQRDAERRFRLDGRLGRLPGLRHLARVLAVEARRSAV